MIRTYMYIYAVHYLVSWLRRIALTANITVLESLWAGCCRSSVDHNARTMLWLHLVPTQCNIGSFAWGYATFLAVVSTGLWKMT